MGGANLATLTELLPANIAALAAQRAIDDARTPTITLSLEAPPDSVVSRLCGHARSAMGRLRGWISLCRHAGGFISGHRPRVIALPVTPDDSLLHAELRQHEHDDAFVLQCERPTGDRASAEQWLGRVLEGFLQQRPLGVSWLMRLRNVLVRPLRLRTSPLGCPVSSLLSTERDQQFLGRYPVLAQRVDVDGLRAQVVLGADDRHLRFRSCVGVRLLEGDRLEISLGTRVACKNAFGRFYMAMIATVHQRYISPAMLRHAVEHALAAAPAGARIPMLRATSI